MKTLFTTGQVAQMVHFSAKTVAKWCDNGRLKHFRIPGSKKRRIPREALVRFLKAHSFNHVDLPAVPTVLVVSPNSLLCEYLTAEFADNHAMQVRMAKDPFEAGFTFSPTPPDVLVIDFLLRSAAAHALCRKIRVFNNNLYIVALKPTQRFVDRALVNETWTWPYDIELLVERIRTLSAAVTQQ